MGFYGRNDQAALAAQAAEEARRRLDEEVAAGRLHAVEDAEQARARGDTPHTVTARLRDRIRRALGR